MDNTPREGQSDEQAEFLRELSATIMDHLLSQRATREEYREEKMARALGLFVRGKSDLNEGIYSRESDADGSGQPLAHVNKRWRISNPLISNRAIEIQASQAGDPRIRRIPMAALDLRTHKTHEILHQSTISRGRRTAQKTQPSKRKRIVNDPSRRLQVNYRNHLPCRMFSRSSMARPA